MEPNECTASGRRVRAQHHVEVERAHRTVRVERQDSILSDRRVSQLMLLRAGRPFDLVRLDSSVAMLRDAMWEQGYADARIDTTSVVNDTANVAELTVTTKLSS